MREFCETRHPFYDTYYYTKQVLSDLLWSIDEDNEEHESNPSEIANINDEILACRKWIKAFDKSVMALRWLKNQSVV